ncbi:MAG: nucleoside hydrolase [Nitrososphaeria archaeon]|nr:nucleoside hydrolase [Nitrososphaeria archaeon]
MRRKVILDMDPGIDDALAILLACNSPELEVLGISIVSGNVHAEKGAVNALRTLEFLDRVDIPVYIGQKKPLLREHVSAEEIHGADGLGDAGIPMPHREPEKKKGVEFIIDTIMSYSPREITLIATGPLTNIALALLLEPEVTTRIRDLIIMGGAYNVTQFGFGNATPVSEFNIYCDPEAARIVFQSGANITAVGLDVTTDPRAVMRRDLYDGIKKMGTRSAEFVSKICKRLIELFGEVQLHDPMAVAFAIDETLFKTTQGEVKVIISDDITRGQTIVDRRPYPFVEKGKPNTNIVCEVDGSRFLQLFLDRLK